MCKPVLLVLAIALSPITAYAKEPPVFDPTADPATTAAAFLQVDKPKALAGITRVAITNFRVEFAVENSANASSSGTMGATAVKADIKLTGITDQACAVITDALYDGFVADLGAVGIEVIPYDTLKGDTNYQSLGKRLLPSPSPLGTKIGKSLFVGPHGAPVYTSNDDKHLGLGALMGGFGAQPQNIEPQIAKSLDAAVLRVVLSVQFAEQKKSGGMFHSGAAVNTGIRLGFAPGLSQVLVVTPGAGKARITLESLVSIEDPVIVIKDATSGGEKAAQAIGNVITGLATGITHSSRNLEAVAEPEGYSAGIQRYGLSLGRALVHAIHPRSPTSP